MLDWPLSVVLLTLFGRRNRVAGVLVVQVSAIGLSTHWPWVSIDAEMVTWRRHFPSCMTSGKSTPQGTLVRTKCPTASVNAAAIGWPVTRALQESQLTPVGIAVSSAFGMDTITLDRGL
jgi:hypothetical protein